MAEYSGFIQDPIEVIQRLRNDLGDRYKRGFPVLKELAQNADDAKATHIIFGVAPGIAEANHLLLQGPGLFVINNGAFEAKHDRGIRSYGISNKATDRSAVGKFGLGMKSVFHFCEAFFFLGHIPDRGPVARIVNPWSVPEHLRDDFRPVHPSWEAFTDDDAALIRDALASVTAKLPTGVSDSEFILWLPLRRQTHREEGGEDTGVIIQEFPGDGDGSLAFLNEHTLSMQVADLLPLLRHVEEIRFQPLASGLFSPFSATVDAGAQRLCFLRDVGERALQGRIKLTVQNGSVSDVRFLGRETHHWIDELEQIYQGSHWPETHSTDALGRAKVQRDKAEPHAAVVLTSTTAPPNGGSLTIRWAVFLPLEESLVSESVSCDTDQHFCCTLHGHFFVDAGRRGIHGFDVLGTGEPDKPVDSVDAVRIGWNRHLATKGTLPLILPIFHESVSGLTAGRQEETGRLLAAALASTQLWSRFRQDITSSGQWVLALTRSGSMWQLLDQERELLPLPAAKERDRDRPWRVFPVLEQLQGSCTPIVADAPKLSSHRQIAPHANQLELLLDSVEVATTLSKKTDLAYLVDTLQLSAELGSLQPPHLRRQLSNLLREGLRQIGITALRANLKEVQRLIGLLPPTDLLAIGGTLPLPLLERLVATRIDRLVVPSDFFIADSGVTASLPVQQADELLGTIATWIAETTANGRNDAVLGEAAKLFYLVDATSRPALLRSLEDIKIIRAFDGRANRWCAVSPKQLGQAFDAALLFRRGQVSDDQGLSLARPLQQALANQTVVLVERETLELLPQEFRRISSCDAAGAIDALGSQPHALREPTTRQALIRRLADPGTGEAAKRGLRFLLHGREGRWSDVATPLWVRDVEEGAAWERLWSQLNEDWNLVDPELAQFVSDPVRANIGVKRIRPQDLLDAVAMEGVAKIDPNAFTAEECTQILGHAHDETVWRMLPLHLCTDGSRCDAIGPAVYLDKGESVPTEIQAEIRIIRRSANDAVRQRQSKLLTPFGAVERLRLMLQSPQPERFAERILEDIENLGADLHVEDSDLLVATAWVPNAQGRGYKPSDIIDCGDPSGLIRDLAAQLTEGTYTFVDLLPVDLREHPGFKLLQERALLAQGDDALETLGLLIAELPEYHLGEIQLDQQAIEKAIPVLADIRCLPGWSLLETLTKEHDSGQIVNYVVHEMAQPLDNELAIVVEVLGWLRRQGQINDGRRAAFELYLQRFAELPEAKNSLPSIELIDSGGHWRATGRLCAGAPDIDRRSMLCESQQAILHELLVPASSLSGHHLTGTAQANAVQGAQLAALLEDFFSPWRDKVAEALIGCFVFVCGPAPEIQTLVERYRGNRTGLRDWLLAKLPWSKRPDGEGLRQTWAYINWKDPAETMEYYDFSAVIIDRDEVVVTSILGEPLRVKRATTAKSFVTVAKSDDQVVIQLSSVDIGQYSASDLSEMLRKSIRIVAEVWADNRLGDLSPLWAELEISDQIAIHVARSLILEGLPILSTQLKLKHHAELNRAFSAFDNAGAQVVEFRGHARATELEGKKREALEQIQRLIENDKEARGALLDAVRCKIRDYQYNTESIPFELFQNADDAVCERLEIDQFLHGASASLTDAPLDRHRFLVAVDNETLTFMHWGRPLNASGEPFPGRERHYHRDLQKMLIIGASAKQIPSTGKFGLGFKSVFLACDEPELVSGRLSVKILGGMLPIQLDDDGGIRKLLRSHEPGHVSAGTAIRLRTHTESPQTILRHFQAMAGVLCCFAKAIRQIDFLGGSSHAWSPTALAFAPGLSVGSLTVPDQDTSLLRFKALRIDLGTGALLLAMNGEGLCRLPNTVPTLWILAPTAEDDALGFALNGRFHVDAGRTRLADSEEANLETAGRLGDALHQVLKPLVSAIQDDWRNVQQALALQQGIDPYDFLYTLWQTLVGGLQVRESSKVRSLALRVVQQGLGTLGLAHAVLPNGLPGKQRALLGINDIRLVLRGALSIPEVLKSLSEWDCFADALKPRETIRSDIHDWAALAHPPYGSRRGQWKSVKLVDWVAQLMDDNQQIRVAPVPARIWGGIFDSLSEADLTREQRDDLADAERIFSNAHFQSTSGGFAPAVELLDSGGDNDERRRWGFAPDEHRIAAAYDEAGRSLLRRCRGARGFSANAQQLARWIRELPDDPARRPAALEYLRDGELSWSVVDKLHQAGLEGTWLAALTRNSDYFLHWDTEQILRLLTQFQSTDRLESLFQPNDIEPDTFRPAVDVAKTLEKLRDWWGEDSSSWIEKYEKDVYPGAEAPAEALRFEDEADFTGDRSAWLSLFLLGHFHTLGLVGHAQNRGFIEKCRQEGWWNDAFIKPNPEKNPDAWMNVLDEYIEAQTDQQTYEHWMQRFPAIYRLARYLDDYRDLMLGLPTWKWAAGECRLDQVTRPRITPRLQGGGISAPPFHKTLGIGACFVVRELLRLGVITGENAPHACAYVPTKGIRDLLAGWGYDQFDGAGADAGLAKDIHRILVQHLSAKDARFGGAYDIPLQLMAYEPEIARHCTVYQCD